jgi:hypothetical protein
MLSSAFVAFVAFANAATAAPTASCTADQRIKYSQMVPYAYAQPGVVAVKQAFEAIPFGVPNLDGPCSTVM